MVNQLLAWVTKAKSQVYGFFNQPKMNTI